MHRIEHYKRFFLTGMVGFSMANVHAVEYSSGDFNLNVDTTLSYGQSYRTSDHDRGIIGITADPIGAGLSGTDASITGTAFSENVDDGNQNFDQGIISNIVRFTTEFDAEYKQFGLFMRANGFKDFENDDAGDRTPLSDKAERLVADNINLQDLYVWSDFSIGNMPASIRIGEQVLSWGESTFIQNGINVINPFDVSKLRTPGSEIRDALLPVGMVSLSLATTESLTVEGYYQYDWERTIIEPSGSYFSTNDFVGDGGNRVMLGFGSVSDRGTLFGAANAAGINAVAGAVVVDPSGFDDNFLAISRAPDQRPDNGGEFGFSFKYFSESMNDTEFGAYFINHHSRTPIISARTGTAAAAAQAGATAVALAGVPATAAFAGPVATDVYAQSANYFIQYPEDIQRLGFSFNTQFKGIAFQGEYTFINDAPLQIDDVEILFTALCPINAPLLGAPGLNQIDPGCVNTGFEEVIPGYIERNMSQLQMTATKILGPVFNANTGVLVGEIGVTHVHGMPEKSDLRLNSAGTFVSGNTMQGTVGLHAGKPAEDPSKFADATSWGYRIAGRLTYNDVFAGVNVLPRFAWSHDMNGNTPGPGGNFLEGRKAITLGLGFDYQNTWQADVSYTNFFGAGRYNLLNDRDFAAFNLKYSF